MNLPCRRMFPILFALTLLGLAKPALAADAASAALAQQIAVALPKLSIVNQVNLCKEPVARWKDRRINTLVRRSILAPSYDMAKTRSELADVRDYDVLVLEAWGVAAAVEAKTYREKLTSPKNDREVLRKVAKLTKEDLQGLPGISAGQAYHYWAPVCANIVQSKFRPLVRRYYASQKLRRAMPSNEAQKAAASDIRFIEKQRSAPPAARVGIRIPLSDPAD